MKNVFKLSILCATFLFATSFSCNKEDELSEEQITEGLKEALKVGANNSASILSAADGYFADAIIKILLPPEAKTITDNLVKIPGGQALYDKTVLGINRSAEDAAKEVAPIFVDAITGMTVSDASNILFGADDAATQYLKTNTSTQLINLFKPKMDASLSKPLVGNVSTKSLYSDLVSAYNAICPIFGFQTVTNTDLTDYVTQKGLDGVFVKVAAEELKIRKDPVARVSDILKKVFGELDK